MNQYYNQQDARNALEQLACEEQAIDKHVLSKFIQKTEWKQTMDLLMLDKPKSWQLVERKAKDKQNDPVEEMIFTMQGILCEKDLPPITEKPVTSQDRYKFLRQGVCITGLGTPTFDKAIEAAQEIYKTIKREFPEGQLESWLAGEFRGHHSLAMSNRYLTPTKDAPHSEHVPFESTVDPHGILENMAKAGYVHCEENVVRYYSQNIDEHGKHK